jgi:hypothetical protein
VTGERERERIEVVRRSKSVESSMRVGIPLGDVILESGRYTNICLSWLPHDACLLHTPRQSNL